MIFMASIVNIEEIYGIFVIKVSHTIVKREENKFMR